MPRLPGNFSVSKKSAMELGFSSSPRFALYGIGLLPAVRVEIDDPRKVVRVGQIVRVKVTEVERARERVSLSMRGLTA